MAFESYFFLGYARLAEAQKCFKTAFNKQYRRFDFFLFCCMANLHVKPLKILHSTASLFLT